LPFSLKGSFNFLKKIRPEKNREIFGILSARLSQTIVGKALTNAAVLPGVISCRLFCCGPRFLTLDKFQCPLK